MPVIRLENENAILMLDLSKGVCVTGLIDKRTAVDHLPGPSSLFGFHIDNSCLYKSDDSNFKNIPGVIVDDYELSASSDSCVICCRVNDDIPLYFKLFIESGPFPFSFCVRSHITNKASAALNIIYMIPFFEHLHANEPNDPVTKLRGSFNTLEAVHLISGPDNTGIFACDLASDKYPVQISQAGGCISGVWHINDLLPDECAITPDIGFGIAKRSRFAKAACCLIKSKKTDTINESSPDWLNESGGIFLTGAANTSALRKSEMFVDLDEQISSFTKLPGLFLPYIEAGINVMLLSDYWEGEKKGFPKYWHMGDYTIRSDLGGEESLVKGIKDIHNAGGKVIFFLDPLKAHFDSQIGFTAGNENCLRGMDGNMFMTDFLCYTMSPSSSIWRDHLIKTVRRFIGEYDADGIYLNSIGNTYNLRIRRSPHSSVSNPYMWNDSLLKLTWDIKRAGMDIKPDFVVLSENISVLPYICSDGAICKTMSNFNPKQISPYRDFILSPNIFIHTKTNTDLSANFANGYVPALNAHSQTDPAVIKKLTGIRYEYRDSLIYGHMTELDSNFEDISAFIFKGDKTTVITILNTGCDHDYKSFIRSINGGPYKELTDPQDQLPGLYVLGKENG